VANTTDKIKPVTSQDHVKGNPNAPIKIVAYSDFECPFCQRFHNTMNELMEKYGEDGEVAWVFRQFPLEQLHPVKAQAVAVASECANELAGNDGFWKFADRYFELTLTNNRTDTDVVLTLQNSSLAPRVENTTSIFRLILRTLSRLADVARHGAS
jgi:thiol-disulfide isomerase/thioredoxin